MTVGGLLADMEQNGVDASIVFCIAEKVSVVRPANDFLIGICDNKRLISFGTIHPDFEDYKSEIQRLRDHGIKGIKFHSLFQGFVPDEERMFRIYSEMGEDLIAFFHVGIVPGSSPDAPQATPEGIARVLDAFPKLRVVAAHLGGMQMLDEVQKHLIGKNLYLDSVWPPSIDELDPNLVAQIITEHGLDKIIFGTDYPMTDTRREIKGIMNLPLSAEDKERILGGNAAKLLGIEVG